MTQQVPGEPRHEADGPISVERLIGPAGPELGCEECFSQLDAYVELELVGGSAGTAMPAMDAHLVGCPACRDDRDSLLAFLLADPPDPGNGNGGLLARGWLPQLESIVFGVDRPAERKHGPGPGTPGVQSNCALP